MQRASRYFDWQASLSEKHLGRRVLEVGCGLGIFTSRLLDREMVIGVDVVGECVVQHRKRFASHIGVSRLSWISWIPVY